jgi:phosphatidylinositol dimannoside acyltransferase
VSPGETLKETTAYWGYRGIESLAMSLPESIGMRAFSALGRVGHATMNGVRATVAANQAHVLGLPLDDERVRLSTREAFDLYARYWYDTFRIRALSPDVVDAKTDMVDEHHIDRALEQGKGVICVLPHMGNWDVGGRWFAANGYRIAAVAEELKPPRLSELFIRHRESLGLRIVPLSKNGHVGQQLKQLLSENWMVALVADRDLGGRGIEVEMFGAPRRLPAGPALLSITSGAPLVLTPVYTMPQGWQVRIGSPLEFERTGGTRADVRALTRVMAAEFERTSAAKPPDWHMFQPGWDDARARERSPIPAP